MTFDTIPYITLWAVQFEKEVEYYTTILELPVKHQSDNFIQFATKGTELYIHRILGTHSPLRPETVEVHFTVSDVDKAVHALKDKGIVFEQEPQNMPWGTRIASVRDPEGYVVEFVGPLKTGENIAHHPNI